MFLHQKFNDENVVIYSPKESVIVVFVCVSLSESVFITWIKS